MNGPNEQPGTLLLFARDPGSANQVLALYEMLTDQISGARPDSDSPVASLVRRLATGRSISDIRVAASRAALALLGDAGIAVEDWDSVRDIDAISARLADGQVAEIVTGLSDRDDRTPQKLWFAAKALGARTTALLDDTTVAHRMARADLDQRFRLPDGELVLPSVIAAIDDQSRNALIAAGITADGALVVAAVDGRNAEPALGLGLHSLGELMAALGAERAMNLDGGSSKRLIVDGEIVDLPSIGVQGRGVAVEEVRPLHTAVLLHLM